MPNYCSYSMKATGSPEELREFIEVIQRDNYESGRHFFRVFEASIADEETVSEGYVEISGECAWSVYSCMMEGPSTYAEDAFKKYEEAKKEIEKHKGKKDLVSRNNYLYDMKKLEGEMLESSLLRESRLLNLTIEVFSEELGMEFQEHYVIENGVLLLEKEANCREYETTEFNTVEEFSQTHELNISKEQFESDDYIVVGGFGDWEFDKYREENQ